MAQSSTVGPALSVASLIVMPVLATAKLRVARAMRSGALRADAPVILWQGWETLEDARMEAAQPDDGGRGRS